MIDWFQAVLLALVQGLTEFLPISSSAHLVIPSLILEWPDQGLAFDVAVHLGTLLAVVIYYRHDLCKIAVAWFASLGGGEAGAGQPYGLVSDGCDRTGLPDGVVRRTCHRVPRA